MAPSLYGLKRKAIGMILTNYWETIAQLARPSNKASYCYDRRLLN